MVHVPGLHGGEACSMKEPAQTEMFAAAAEHDFGYEPNEASQAYVPQSNKHVNPYFSGAVMDGKAQAFEELAKLISMGVSTKSRRCASC